MEPQINSSDPSSDFFESKYLEYGTTVQALGWSRLSQFKRFVFLNSILDLNKKTILDVGSGFGDFAKFLIANQVKFKEYVGIEPNKNFFNNSDKKFFIENIKFYNVSTETFSPHFIFDVSICVGTFNLKQENNLEYILKQIDLIKTYSNIIFIMLLSDHNSIMTIRHGRDSEKVYFYNVQELVKILESKYKCEFFIGYLPHDAALRIEAL